MKFLLLTLSVFLILFQMLPVCRGRKSCWIIKGHCRKDCKSGEQVKKPCRNGDYCCVPSKTDSQPHRPTQATARKYQTFTDKMKRNAFLEQIPIILNNKQEVE
ncbi:beta-defensin 118-like [Cervus elaphus]|nr:beta-defensin 118-like [Cervus canadensis]XP_043738756.1 beta-defensin 118-like [Cervus elaphus]